MLTQKPAAQLLGAEVARASEIEDKRFLFGEHLLLRQVVRAAALALQSRNAVGLVPAPPLPQRRPGYATAAADYAGVAKLLVKADPAETRPCIHRFVAPAGWLGI